jgi:hypothetical protein
MIITTSWDDGHPLDMKLLELLEKYNLKATFYIPLSNSENPVMEKNAMRELSNFQEVGCHTLSHIYLNGLNYKEAEFEITECKVLMEEIIGKQIDAFCFPGGKFSDRDLLLVKKAGYLFARTTKLLAISNPQFKLMNTSIQAYNHSSVTLLLHCILNLNMLPIRSNWFFMNFNRNFLKLAEHYISANLELNSVFHVWGHSYEIEQYNLWHQVEDLFKMISSYHQATFLNNTETWKSINSIPLNTPSVVLDSATIDFSKEYKLTNT